MQLTLANVRNDIALVQEVRKVIDPIAKAWAEINPSAGATNQKVGA